jgi:hypothetical protein
MGTTTYSPEKPSSAYMSGIPSMCAYSSFLRTLELEGFTHEKINRLTYSNIKNVFKKIVE